MQQRAIVQLLDGCFRKEQHLTAAPASIFREDARGCPAVCVAVLDGPADLSHPCFAGATIANAPSSTGISATGGAATAHGTHVASILFGQDGTSVPGLIPRCRGLIAPVFADGPDGDFLPCSQLDLARAIFSVIEAGANVINISGGELAHPTELHPLLAEALTACVEKQILVIAAAGNDGCDCVHIPAFAPSVIVVGAIGVDGNPMPSSNWGPAYREHGIIAPGQNILGAGLNDDVVYRSGTSYAAPIVSGVAALLLSMQFARTGRIDTAAVRDALLDTAGACDTSKSDDCRPHLRGKLNVPAAIQRLGLGRGIMTSDIDAIRTRNNHGSIAGAETIPSPLPAAADGVQFLASSLSASEGMVPASENPKNLSTGSPEIENRIRISDCGCGCGGAKKESSCQCNKADSAPTLVFAIGKIGIDYGTDSRRVSLAKILSPEITDIQLLDYLDQPENEYLSQSLIWTLQLGGTPIYAIQPAGAYAAATYQELRKALRSQLEEGSSIAAIPGVASGSQRLVSGQTVPILIPAQRGINYYSSEALIADVLRSPPEDPGEKASAARRRQYEDEVQQYRARRHVLEAILNRIYNDMRNFGVTGADRALNYAATNIFELASNSPVILRIRDNGLELDRIGVAKSLTCAPGSECYDVEMSFFSPFNVQLSNTVFRYTIDVSDVVPFRIGDVVWWSRRG